MVSGLMDGEWGHFHTTTCTSVRESCKQGVIGYENTPQAIVCDGGRIYTDLLPGRDMLS